MIKIQSVTIQEFRGIRELTLPLAGDCFVVSGPNGSGKSGVVDAIQFALTGNISRLTGAGTKDLKLAEHGPHVVMKDYPDASWVSLEVSIPHLSKTASIKREVKNPKRPTITPTDKDVECVFSELEAHPEITLSRREIIKFILTEATKRSQDVQTLLKLDRIDQVRAALKTTENRLNSLLSLAEKQTQVAKLSLQRHLDVEAITTIELLEKVNRRRAILNLPKIAELKKTTCVSEGISDEGSEERPKDTKETALKDLGSFLEEVHVGLEESTKGSVQTILGCLEQLGENPQLLSLIKLNSFLQSGLELIEGPNCPFCGLDWNEEHLRQHVRERIGLSEESQRIESIMLDAGLEVSKQIVHIDSLVNSVTQTKEIAPAFLSSLEQWRGTLSAFSESMTSVEGIIGVESRLESKWVDAPGGLKEGLESLLKKVEDRPEDGGTGAARDYLVLAQDRLNSWRVARRSQEAKRAAAVRGRLAHATYGDVAENALLGLYQEVEGDFASFYQLINQDDEGDFSVKFQPDQGKLGLVVDFHQKGMYPPGAYHSEGHQDGMGVCLYLALMKKVLGDRFTLAVLDDVVMSVDSQHRKRFCKLLKIHFPGTQFIITTHDQVWAKQMRTEGVVGAKNSIAFHSWTVDSGPILDELTEVWDQINADLDRNDVGSAAAKLRRHLEFVSADLADELCAKVDYRGDGGYGLGDFLPAVIGRQGELLKKAMRAAKSWESQKDVEEVNRWMEKRREVLADQAAEQWIINKAVHHNEWTNLAREDFIPVVDAFKRLIEQFRCVEPMCGTWVSVTPRVEPSDLRCSCGAMRLNLKSK